MGRIRTVQQATRIPSPLAREPHRPFRARPERLARRTDVDERVAVQLVENGSDRSEERGKGREEEQIGREHIGTGMHDL